MGRTPIRRADIAQESPRRSSARHLRLSLGGCLALAFVAVLVVLVAGMRFAQQSTRETAVLVAGVESRYEPVLRLSRDLGEAVTNFDRQVVELSGSASPAAVAAAKTSGTRMLAIFEDFTRLAPDDPVIDQSHLREGLQDLEAQGLVMIELYRSRSAEVQQSLKALDVLASRAARAGSGVEAGDQVFARKSLAEVSRSAAALRATTAQFFATPSPPAADAVARDRAAFAKLLRVHAAEFAHSPGRAWLDLERDDFAAASAGETRFQEIERRIEPTRESFDRSAEQLAALVQADFQKPAWEALTRAAARARITAENAEHHLARVAAAVLGVVLAIAAMLAYGIIGPARKLLEGTRRLARGALDTRVPRGGVRELDELAAAFNDMARALDVTQTELRDQQLALEDRVAERTEQLRYLANHDPLTGLPNRRGLEAHLAAAIDRARTGTMGCAVFYMDVDNFKTINDSLGHQFGDRVLREIGARLRDVAGRGGFLARLGGDEFTLVAGGIASGAAAEAYVREITQAFQKPVRADDRELLVSLSIGIALCPDHGHTSEALLRAADSALFQAKDRGRNGFSLYRAELLAAASHRFHTEQGLRRALEAGELLLYFQPEVSLLGLQTTAVEALLRWRQPDGRVASAGEFMGVAEQSGLILELSDWVLRRAIDAARQLRGGVWPRARVAVNVSAQQFLTGRFVESVERALRDARMPADCLEIELTETAVQTGRLAVDALHDLRRIGVAVALDDFGAGYSSLKSLDELPLTRVKLDRGLTHGIDSNASAAAIAGSVVRLCQSLGLTVTAEGIERPEQLDFLANYGEVQVQGYLIARPAPIEDVARFIPETAARVTAAWRKPPPVPDEPALAGEPSTVTFLRPRTR
jgi:diguanylate cyclase (GGDEF)-like protein